MSSKATQFTRTGKVRYLQTKTNKKKANRILPVPNNIAAKNWCCFCYYSLKIESCKGVQPTKVVHLLQHYICRRSSEIQGTALGKSLRAWTCIYRSMPAGVAQSRHVFVGGYSEYVRKMTDTRKQKAEKVSEMPINHSLFVGNTQIG